MRPKEKLSFAAMWGADGGEKGRVRRPAQRWKKIQKKSIKHEECGWNYNNFFLIRKFFSRIRFCCLKSGDFNFSNEFESLRGFWWTGKRFEMKSL
jgi:hypothetical protein